jgi:hypothetical protein
MASRVPDAIQPMPIPLPPRLPRRLHNKLVPWDISPRIFREMKKQKRAPFKKVQVLPTDPEWRFVWEYFNHDKPHRFAIKAIFCVHRKPLQQMFEANFSSIEAEARQFKPDWDQEPRADQRAAVIDRWRAATDAFTPFDTKEAAESRRRNNWQKTKVLPMWHGGNASKYPAIAESGFTYFGKTSLGAPVQPGSKSTDIGFFGSGIYFTNSARYASDIYSSGDILLAWVSMREPFPVVGDPTQKDMQLFAGGAAYKNYNAHYVPVQSIDPKDPFQANYYPPQKGNLPHCDELVVFQKSQTLPRFWVELEVEVPYLMQPSQVPQFAEDLVEHLMKVLQNPGVDRDQKLRNHLGEELAFLLRIKRDDYLDTYGDKYPKLYGQLCQLINAQGKVSRVVSRAITDAPMPGAFVQDPASNMGVAPVPAVMALPPAAFGAAKWAQYFGDVGDEPPLPPNIDRIMAAPCPYWEGKTVAETHTLMLMPSEVDGQPFTLNVLSKMMTDPKDGDRKLTLHQKESYFVFSQLAQESIKQCFWGLITKSPIPKTAGKNYLLAQNFLEKEYTVPKTIEIIMAMVMEYVDSGGIMGSPSREPGRRSLYEPRWLTFSRDLLSKCYSKPPSSRSSVFRVGVVLTPEAGLMTLCRGVNGSELGVEAPTQFGGMYAIRKFKEF